jgi:hypothetical protein
MRLSHLALLIALALLALLLWEQSSRPPTGRSVATGPDAPEAVGPRANQPLDPQLGGKRSELGGREEPATTDAADARAAATEPLRQLQGLLVDEDSRRPLADRVLFIGSRERRAEPRVEVRTDREGRFEVPLATGEYVIGHLPLTEVVGSEPTFEVEPLRFEVRPAAEPLELTFRARRPPAVLEVDVVHADGRPAVAAFVRYEWPFGDHLPSFDLRARTDARGRARLGVWRPDAPPGSHVRAWTEDGLVSELLAVDTPFEPYVRRLVLGPGGELEVRVLFSDGALATGSSVRLTSPALRGPRARLDVDAEARAVFTGLVPGPYRLDAIDDTSEVAGRTSREVLVRAGERTQVEAFLADSSTRLAVSGRVLDEERRPLPGVELVVTPSLGGPVEVRTDDDGLFHVRSRPCEGSWIDANLTSEQDRLEPSRLWVEFGATGVEFVRVEQLRTVRFDIEVVDRASGNELSEFTLSTDRGPGTEQHANRRPGARTFELPALEETRLTVAARDHLPVTLPLFATVAELEPGTPLRVELDLGLRHELRVLELDTDEPIPGVLFRSPTAPEARTDPDGRVLLSADHWSTYEVTRAGYQPTTFETDEGALWGWTELRLFAADDTDD